MNPKLKNQELSDEIFKKGDIIVLNCHLSYGKDPQLNEICIVNDVDCSNDSSVCLEGYKSFYSRHLFILMKRK